MRVELLYWEGCPSHAKALQELKEAMADVGRDPGGVVVREVTTEAQAGTERFVGSPTVRIDGMDVQPPGEEPAGLTCRVYRRRDGRISPTPDPADLRDALRRAKDETGEGTEEEMKGKTGEETKGKTGEGMKGKTGEGMKGKTGEETKGKTKETEEERKR